MLAVTLFAAAALRAPRYSCTDASCDSARREYRIFNDFTLSIEEVSQRYVLDANEKPVNVESGTAKAQVLIGKTNHNVEFKPAGNNMLKATGDFTSAKGMKVIVTTTKVGGKSFQARLAPLN